MQSILNEKKEAKEEIYLILADFFKNPNEDLYSQISNGSIDQRLKELCIIAGYSKPNNSSLKNHFEDYPSYVNSFTRCFTGITKPYAPPVESVYKIWTDDPSNGMYNQKGYIFGDSALHIKYLFDHYKLEVPEEFKSLPDHLTLLLELLAYMIKFKSPTEAEQLIIDHFDWLEDFEEKLSKVENSAFYLVVTKLITNFTQSELLYLRENLK